MKDLRREQRRCMMLAAALCLMLTAVAAADDAVLVKALEARTQAAIRKADGSIVALLRPPKSTAHPVQGAFGEPAADHPAEFIEAVATGVIVARQDDPTGRYILTTCHALLSVVDDRSRLAETRVRLQLPGRRTAEARVVSADSRCDLAFLQLLDRQENAGTLRPLEISAQASDEKGTFAVVLGDASAVARDGSAAGGLSSVVGVTAMGWNGRSPEGIDRELAAPDLSAVWHLSTTVAGGTDGGAVLDLEGRLLALTTGRVNLDRQLAQATFAMPLASFLSPLIRGEEIRLGFLGLEVQSGDGDVGLVRVAPGSPADEAGLQVGDRVTHWNGEPIAQAGHLHRRMWLTAPGSEVKLTVRRAGVGERTIPVTTIRWPVRDSEIVFATSGQRTWRGITIDAATARTRWLEAGLFGRLNSGARVLEITPGSPAATLNPGQLITAVNGVDVTTAEDFIRLAPASGPVRLRLADGEVVDVPER